MLFARIWKIPYYAHFLSEPIVRNFTIEVPSSIEHRRGHMTLQNGRAHMRILVVWNQHQHRTFVNRRKTVWFDPCYKGIFYFLFNQSPDFTKWLWDYHEDQKINCALPKCVKWGWNNILRTLNFIILVLNPEKDQVQLSEVKMLKNEPTWPLLFVLTRELINPQECNVHSNNLNTNWFLGALGNFLRDPDFVLRILAGP